MLIAQTRAAPRFQMLRLTRPRVAAQRCRYCAHRSLSTPTKTVKLAYNLHEPPQPTDASPLVILHGLFGSKSNWQSLSKAFARDLSRKVYALDARNHGHSPHDPTHSYDAMSDDVLQFFKDHGIESPILMGHSMGAKTCMTLALRHPRQVKLLIPVDNAPLDAAISSDFGKYVRRMRDIESRGVNKQSEADAMLKDVEENLGIRQFLLTNLVKPSASASGGGQSAEGMRFRVPLDILGRALDAMGDFPIRPEHGLVYRQPTLFVRGRLSKYVPDDVLPLIGQLFPRFKVEDVDAGHWVQAEKPDDFKRIVCDWIRDEEEKLVEQM